jgi:hypothetical protein
VDVAAFVERLRVSKAQVRHTSWVPANAACHDAPPGFALPCELAAVLARAGAMPLYRRVRMRAGCAHAALHAADTAAACASTALLCFCVASHQSSAIAAALAGRSVVVSTPTASGKSLWCAARSQHARSTICTRVLAHARPRRRRRSGGHGGGGCTRLAAAAAAAFEYPARSLVLLTSRRAAISRPFCTRCPWIAPSARRAARWC